MKLSALTVVAGAALALCNQTAHAVEPAEIVRTYSDIALAGYEDSLSTAKALDAAIESLASSPSEASLSAARAAWIAARVPYQQTEAFRFGNPIVDEWEGGVNAWPLDEGLIDYVDASYGTESDANPFYAANIIANSSVGVGGQAIDATTITPELIRSLQEVGGSEANVAAGYHAIEFLLWGQDLNGTGPGAGKRPATDFDTANCTGGHCDRRVQYLKAATDLLVADLETMVANWKDGGAARQAVESDPAAGLESILTGLGSLSYGELAGERMKLGLLLHDPEEEHDCFSDNTHNSHYYDIVGMKAVWDGSYARTDGTVVSGPSAKAFAEAKAPEEAAALTAAIADTLAKAQVMKDTADSGKMAYDQMLGEGNAEGNKIVQDVIDALVAQTRATEALVAKLGLSITVEGSDSLDNPAAVQ